MASNHQYKSTHNKRAAINVPLSRKASFYLEAQLGHYFYGESRLMNQRGPSYGASLGYSNDLAKDSFMGENAFSSASIDVYSVKGYYRSVTTGEFDNDDSSVTKIKIQMGYHLNPNQDIAFGLGVRALTNDNTGMKSSTGHYGYLREQSYIFIPVKWVYHIPIKTGKVSLGVGSDHFVRGKHTVAKRLDFDQTKGWNINGDVSYLTGPYMAKFFASYWDIGESDHLYAISGSSVLQIYEPKNHTFRYGMSFGMRF